MNIDILFTAVEDSAWKESTKTGEFVPKTVEEHGYIKCFEGQNADEIINRDFKEATKVLLIVIDPLRIQSPVKQLNEDGIKCVAVQGTFSIDAIIDKIKLQKDDNGKFAVRVKHFD